ncbi:MAG: chemotaxis protein CheA [Pseudobdellovibrionaceae bacterium]|nr:chemotaxis protein CheA [Pseudobdellovibrionaceae bacterium]
MDDAEKKLRATFLEEASQLLLDAEQSFLLLESNPNDSGLIDCIFRLAHNIKGSANAVGFADLGHFMHELESLFLKVRNKELKIDAAIVDIFLRCNDLLTVWIATLSKDDSAQVPYQSLLERVREVNAAVPSPMPKMEVHNGFAIFADDPPASTKATTEAAPDFTSTAVLKDDSIRIHLTHVDGLINDIGELVILQTVLKQQKHLVSSPLIQKTIDQLGKITRQIQDSSMGLRMVPLNQTFQKMQRILRDTSKKLGKDVNLHIAGEATGLDKTVLDNLGDPLVHLIRNAVDHGIELPEERLKAGKTAQGNVWLSAYHQSGKLVIEIKDDGRGLDAANLIRIAKKRGVLAEDAALEDKEAWQLIFHPGFSTKSQVTDISGRGVGLDVVKTNIFKLKGEIQLDNQPGHGTCFRIFLPLTLAIIDGMIIGLNETERYVVPLTQVHEIFEVTGAELHAFGREDEVFDIRGKTLPLYHLDKVLGRPSKAPKRRGVVIVSRVNQQEFAFAADMVVSQQQVVIKQLGKDLKKISGVSGSAILGDGKAALILDLEEIAKGRSA